MSLPRPTSVNCFRQFLCCSGRVLRGLYKQLIHMIHILVIEDEPTQRLLTCSVLRSAGYQVTEAVDGSEGLKCAQNTPPDLIVCDVMMPGLNGYELVTALKTDVALATIPVILLTAMAKRSDVRIGMTSGADDYLYKPFRASELRESVKVLLAKKTLQRAHFLQVGESSIIAALVHQKEQLALQYEKRLSQELNERWVSKTEPGNELTYINATVVLVNLFEAIVRRQPLDSLLGSAVQRVYQAACDSLYLFGALHLVPMGDDLLAVFPEPAVPDDGKTRLQALRSVLGMQQMVRAAFESMMENSNREESAAASLNIALHDGRVALVHVDDPFHGSQSMTLAVGEAVNVVKAIGKHAQTLQWRVSCSLAMLEGLDGYVAVGNKAQLFDGSAAPGLELVELLAVAPA